MTTAKPATEATDDVVLLPCPFCGYAKPKLLSNGIGDYFIACDGDDDETWCGASCSDRSCETKGHAAQRWNQRAALTAGKAVPQETVADAVRQMFERELAHWPKHLHPRTSELVIQFAVALAKKLRLSEERYQFADGWANPDWEAECREHLYQHLDKGDPRDVAAYCAFMWHHDWITHRPAGKAVPGEERRAALEEAAKLAESSRTGSQIGPLYDAVFYAATSFVAERIRALLSQRPGQEGK